MRGAGVKECNIYVDKQSGKDFNRPKYVELIKKLERGNLLNGVRFGRPEVATPQEFPKIVREWERKRISFDEALQRSRLSQSTFYRKLREYRLSQRVDM